MHQSEIEARIKDLLSVGLRIKKSSIGVQSRLIDDLGMDSVDAVEMCMAIEDAFDIEIPDEDFTKTVIVQDIIEYVAKTIGVNQ